MIIIIKSYRYNDSNIIVKLFNLILSHILLDNNA
jgi:hypothetical protein